MVQQANETEVRFFGRVLSAEDLKLIKDVVNDFPTLTLTEISRTICELLEWNRPNGHLKSQECRRMLERLRDQGLLRLPELRKSGPRGPRVIELSSLSEARVEINASAGELERLCLKVVKASPGGESRVWRELIERHHYLKYRAPVGATLRYLVYSEQRPGEVVACLMWTSPAWKIEVRDRWIGWDSQTRSRNLQLIVNNARFLIMPWIRSKNLASKILGMCARQVPLDWEQMYGYRPVLMESMVDGSRFRGTCYRAANWILLGQTTGRGRMDRNRDREARAPKLVYVYPLEREVGRVLRRATDPAHVSMSEESA